MRKIRLNENSEIPIIGLGTFRMTNESEVVNTVLKALEIGYRHFDTAKAYNNEHLIGLALKSANIKRNEVFLTTKIKLSDQKADIISQIEDSLEKLETNYLDLVILHWPSQDYDLNYFNYQVLEEYYQKGIIKAIGVSNFNKHHLEDLLTKCVIRPTINQIELHPGFNQLEMQKYLEDENIVLQSYAPFMKSEVFSGKYFSALSLIGAKYQATVAQVIIAWGLARNIVMIPKSTNPQNLKLNFDALKIKLTTDDINLINDLNENRRVYGDPDNNEYYKYRK